jgi:hypothetical protein
MPKYNCKYCYFNTDHKTNFTKHLNTKKHIYNLNLYQGSDYNDTSFPCNLCGRMFKSKTNMYRHRKHRCVKTKEDMLKKEINRLKKELMRKHSNPISNSDTASSCIDPPSDSSNTSNSSEDTSNVTNQITNQITNNNNIIINNITNVHLLSHKDSSISYLTPCQYKQILNRRNNCIQDEPQNMNIYISNIKNGYVLVYNGNNWDLKDKELAIEELMDAKEILLEEWLDEYQDKYPELKEKFDFYLNSKEDSKLLNQMKKEIELCLYNNRKLAKTNGNKIKEQI